MKIPIYKPELPPYEVVEPDIREMYASGMLYPSKYTERLQKQVIAYCKVPYVCPVSSCSLGLILMLNLISPGYGGVIMPSFTFSATMQALEWTGHRPIVVDVDDDGQMKPGLVEDALASIPGVRAVLPVHMWGNACYPMEYEQIRELYGVPVFFDGAHVFGTTYKGKSLAHYGDAVVYSIAATKPVSAGEGGLVVTRDEKIYAGVYEGANHGFVGSLDTRSRGINGKIQEFNSILAYHAIEMFDRTRQRRAEIIGTYRTELADLPIRIWKTRRGVDASYKDCVLFTETSAVRDQLELFLNKVGVGTKRYFDPAVPDMGSFRGTIHSAKNGRKLASTCLTIPLYPALTEREIRFIIRSIRSFFGRQS